MSASDGVFNASVEIVTATIDTTALAPGRHPSLSKVRMLMAIGACWVRLSCGSKCNGPTPTPTDTPPPTDTPTPTDTPLPTNTPTITPTPTNTPTLTNTPIAGDTGFLSPSANAPVTSNAGDKNGFEVNPTNAYADGGGVAQDVNSGSNTNSSCTNKGKDKHQFYNYNVSLPGGVTVKGIEVRLDAFVDAASNSPTMCVQLSWNGGLS